MAYFDKLNYTLSNEDTRVEFELLPNNVSRVFSIGGSGARVLPLVARNPKNLDVIDLSKEQLYLVELRIAAARELSYDEFLFFLGYRGGLVEGSPTGDDRVSLYEKLQLSPACKSFWDEHKDAWRTKGFILLGKWEGHFQKIGFLFRSVLRMDMRPVFEAQSLEEQIDIYNKKGHPLVFRNFLKLVANEYVFNKFLYKGHFSGASDRRTDSRPPWKFLDDEFKRLFTTTLVRKNYFLQVLFLGKILYEEGLPLEAQPHIVAAVKKSQTKTDYRQGDLLELVQRDPYDFISLSDTISYLPQDKAQELLLNLHKQTPSKARVVIRSFLKAPTEMSLGSWKEDSENANWAFNLDGTGVYQFHIYERG